jgi:signal transduction histidine kinase
MNSASKGKNEQIGASQERITDPSEQRVTVSGAPKEIAEFRLMRWFSITSLVAMAVFSIGMALLIDRFVEQRILRHDAELSRDFVQSVVQTQKVAAQFTAAYEGRQSPEFAEFFSHVAAIPDVLRANVYTPDRRVLWSSNEALIGRIFSANEELEEALGGETVVERGIKVDHAGAPKQEHIYIEKEREHFVENYLPVYADGGRSGKPVGVVELYRVPKALNKTLEEAQQLIWSGAAVGGLFLYLSTLSLVHRASRVMREQRNRLIEAQASTMVGEIAAAVAHSIRNPLASIRSSAELQREVGELSPESAGETMQHVDRIEHLLRSLLNYTNDPTDLEGHTDIAVLLDETWVRHAVAFGSQGKELKIDIEPELPAVALAPLLVGQALNSVLSNALEATERGGLVQMRAFATRNQVCVEVQDNGAGMDAAQLGQVFRPFYTTKPRGLGMGLTLVRRILGRQGGNIEIDSQLGHGTRVRLHLPVRPSRG